MLSIDPKVKVSIPTWNVTGGAGGRPPSPLPALRERRLACSPVKLFGYTLGQMLVIGLIALVVIYLAKQLDARVNIPGFHAVVAAA